MEIIVLMARHGDLYHEADRILVTRNPDTVHNLPSLRVEREMIDSV